MDPLALAQRLISVLLTEAGKLLGMSDVDKARALIGAALEILPVDQLKTHLDASARLAADAAADFAENVKFEPGQPPT